MRKRSFITTLGIFGILIFLSFGIFNFLEKDSNLETSKKENAHYFATLPITNWTETKFPTPCLSLQIENKTISSMLDLGFRGQFKIDNTVLDEIKEKNYFGSTKMYGFHGKEFLRKQFEIPKVVFGGIIVHRAYIQEETFDETYNSCIYTENETPSLPEPGTIGWVIFKHLNLFLDLGNEKIAICDSISTLKDEGYFLQSFTSTPLVYDRGFVEIDAELSNGVKRCVLDTGCTLNYLNSPDLLGQIKADIQNIYISECFKIGDKEFGPINFLNLPINLPIHVDAFLGMDFFKDNMVFLDFKNNTAYIAPSIKNSNSSSSL